MLGFWKINGAALRHKEAGTIIGGGSGVFGMGGSGEFALGDELAISIDLPGFEVGDETDGVVRGRSAIEWSLAGWELESEEM